MAGLTASVAGLARSVQGTAIGRGTIPRDVTELAAGVALHGLSLAVSGKVVGTTTFVASGGARPTSKSATEASESASGDRSATAHGGDVRRSRTRSGKVARLTTVVASAVGTSTSQAERGAVGLNVTKTLAVVALLGVSGARQRALVGLVA